MSMSGTHHQNAASSLTGHHQAQQQHQQQQQQHVRIQGHVQIQPQQQQQQQPQQVAGAPSNGAVLDLSSLEHLQAHAVQLSASAGLTSMSNGANPATANGGVQYQQSPIYQHHQQQQQRQQQQQTNLGAPATAPAPAHQTIAAPAMHGLNPQAPAQLAPQPIIPQVQQQQQQPRQVQQWKAPPSQQQQQVQQQSLLPKHSNAAAAAAVAAAAAANPYLYLQPQMMAAAAAAAAAAANGLQPISAAPAQSPSNGKHAIAAAPPPTTIPIAPPAAPQIQAAPSAPGTAATQPPAFLIPNPVVGQPPKTNAPLHFGNAPIFPTTAAAAAAAASILPNHLVPHFTSMVAANSAVAAAAQQQRTTPIMPQPTPAAQINHAAAAAAVAAAAAGATSGVKRQANLIATDTNNPSITPTSTTTDRTGGAANKKRQLAPSVIPSSTNHANGTGATTTPSSQRGSSPHHTAQTPQEHHHQQHHHLHQQLPQGMGGMGMVPNLSRMELEKMSPTDRRRHERNLREQQRSSKISNQINELRDVLSESNVPFKPNKYSILLSVVEYIKQLQSRAIMLDAEHQKLIMTIRQTNEMVNAGATPSSAEESINTASRNGSLPHQGHDSDMLFVQGLDYQSLFDQCPAALGIAALDGRILECNPEFQILMGLNRDDLLKQSLFNLVKHHQEIFGAMAEMLKSAENAKKLGQLMLQNTAETVKSRHWSGPVVSKRDKQLLMNITLTLASDGNPKFFSCALTTV